MGTYVYRDGIFSHWIRIIDEFDVHISTQRKSFMTSSDVRLSSIFGCGECIRTTQSWKGSLRLYMCLRTTAWSILAGGSPWDVPSSHLPRLLDQTNNAVTSTKMNVVPISVERKRHRYIFIKSALFPKTSPFSRSCERSQFHYIEGKHTAGTKTQCGRRIFRGISKMSSNSGKLIVSATFLLFYCERIVAAVE